MALHYLHDSWMDTEGNSSNCFLNTRLSDLAGGLYEQEWINNMEERAKTQETEQNKNHVEKTRFKKPNFGDHQTEGGPRPSGSEDLGLDKCNDG